MIDFNDPRIRFLYDLDEEQSNLHDYNRHWMYTNFLERMDTYHETKVPKIIHQIWFSNAEDEMSTMPPRYKKMSRELRETYPDAKHMWWGREEIKTVWELEELQRYRPMFEGMEHPVLRADIGRILISYVHGGFYVDLDSAPNRDFDSEELFKEIPGGLRLFHDYYTRLYYRGHDRSFLREIEMPKMLHPISNSMLISAPRHPFWLLLLDSIYMYWKEDGDEMIRNVMDIYYKTGPTHYANMYGRAQTILSYICRELYPLDYEYPVHMKHILGTKWQLEYKDANGLNQVAKIVIFVIFLLVILALFFVWRYRENIHNIKWYGKPTTVRLSGVSHPGALV